MPSLPRRARVGGSAFTVFTWGGGPAAGSGKEKILGFARQVSVVSPAPVAAPVAIQPMDTRRPIEIITPLAIGMGTVTVEIFELYNSKVWDDLAVVAGSTDLADVFKAVADTNVGINMKKYIYPPRGSVTGGTNAEPTPWIETYHRCVISNVQDGETIEIGTMDVRKIVEINFTRVTRMDQTVNAERRGSFLSSTGDDDL